MLAFAQECGAIRVDNLGDSSTAVTRIFDGYLFSVGKIDGECGRRFYRYFCNRDPWRQFDKTECALVVSPREHAQVRDNHVDDVASRQRKRAGRDEFRAAILSGVLHHDYDFFHPSY